MTTMAIDNKDKKVLNVPHLRFPEFSGEWDSFKLVELGKFIGGGTPSSSNLYFWTGSIPWISSSDIKEELKEQVKLLKEEGISVCLAVIQVGSDPASSVYVNNKKKACAYIGIESQAYELPEETTQEELLALIDRLNKEDHVNDILDRQITMNSAISDEGLNHPYGAQVGRTLLNDYGNDVRIRARARAAAGSDARMSGCSLPVVINSGSGNQGMTVSLPVIEFA